MDNRAISENDTLTFLDNLRASTAASHKNLENLPLSSSIVSPELSTDAYAKYLKAMYDVVYETENRIFPIIENILPDLDQRKKAPLLERDLATLGTAKVSFESPFASAQTISVAFALGIFYVVEGSALGGRFIIKNIEAVLGFDETAGASYFAGYGNKTGSYWKNFLNILTTYEQEHDAANEIIAGAEYAFLAIHNHFSAQS